MICKYFFICVLLSSSLITSCAKKEEEEFSSVEAISSILGIWSTGCTDGVQATVNFSNTASATSTLGFYYDTSCTVIGYTIEVQQSYVLSNWQTLDNRQTGEIDWTYQSYNVTPSTPQIATAMNNDSFCGYTNWSSGIPKSILGRTCEGQTMPSAGTVDYDLIQYALNSSLIDQGFVPGDLSFGLYDASHDGTSPAARPVQSSSNLRFRK